MKYFPLWIIAALIILVMVWFGLREYKMSEEIVVNTYTEWFQINPSVAMDAKGNFAVVYASQYQDGDQFGIFVRQFNKDGEPVWPEQQVNTFTRDHQKDPAIAMDPHGNFIVVWESWYQEGQRYEIYGQRFNTIGARIGGEFRINDFTPGYQRDPSVALDARGNATVAWLGWAHDGAQGYKVFSRQFSNKLEERIPETIVDRYIVDEQEIPSIEMIPLRDKYGDIQVTHESEQESVVVVVDAQGNYMIAWVEFLGRDGDRAGVFARRFDQSGEPVGDSFQVNNYSRDEQTEVSADMNDRGESVIVWQSEGQDGSGLGVFAKRYDVSGDELSGDIQINTTTKAGQKHPVVALDQDGSFIVVWQDELRDGDETGIFAQWFSQSGARLGEEFQVNLTTKSWQEEIGVDVHNGHAAISWMSARGDADDIMVRLFEKPVGF